nr:retrovirus-related Pol polyprotein from transposon TNT 1-94 [Tanacetum cinerariifolium]
MTILVLPVKRNRVLVTKPHNKTPYELLIGGSPNLEFMRHFRCHVTILNTLDHLGKFDGKADEGFLFGYSVNSKAFRVFNSRNRKVEKNLNVNFLENKPNVAGSRPEWLFDIDSLTKSMTYEPVSAGNQSNGDAGDVNAGDIQSNVDDIQGNKIRIDSSTHAVNAASQTTGIFDGAFDDRDLGAEADTNNLDSSAVVSPIPTTRVHKDHMKEQIIEDPNLNTQTKRMVNFSKETAMDVWTLVDLPYGKRAIGSKWVFRNKLDERGIVIRNKVRLVAQGHTHEEGIDYDEVFALVAMIEAIRLFLAYASFKDFIVYQMDVKSAFLYENIEEEVYVCQPPRFKDPDFPDKVYKVKKALYGLHQALRACTPMETLKPLLKDEDGQEFDVHMYRFMIGSLMYLTSLRPDIMFVTMFANSTTEAEYVAASSCCGQATAKVKKVNDQEQIQALVDKKKVIITEDNIRSDLCFDDAEGTACLLNEAILKAWRAWDMGDTPVETHQTPIVDQPSTFKPQKKQKSRRKQRKEVEVSNDESEDEDHVPTPSSDPLPSVEDSFILNELMVFCTSLQEQRKSRSGGLRRLKKFSSGRRVKPPMEKDNLGAQEDASKHEGMIKEIDQNAKIESDDETQGRTNDDEMFGVDDLVREVVMDTTTGEHEEQIIEDVSTVEPVTTAGEVVTTTTVNNSAALTTDVTKDEITMAQAFAALKSIKPKVVDKGKAKMIELEVSIKKKDQMRIDEELQASEIEEFFKVQKARLLVELIEKRKKHFAALRAQEKRNKPPTKTQMKSQMSTYLKHMGGYKRSHLKGKSFDEIKKLSDREMRKVNDFIAIDSEAQKSSATEAQESSTKRIAEHLEFDISKKEKVDKNVKPVIDDSEELKKCLGIVPDDGDEVLIEAIPLSFRSPTIIDYKIYKE